MVRLPDPMKVSSRLRSPRLLSRTVGLTANGELEPGTPAILTAYRCTGGRARVTMVAKQADTVIVSSAGAPVHTLQLEPGEVWDGTIPARPRGSVCTYGVETSGLLGVTQPLDQRRVLQAQFDRLEPLVLGVLELLLGRGLAGVIYQLLNTRRVGVSVRPLVWRRGRFALLGGQTAQGDGDRW